MGLKCHAALLTLAAANSEALVQFYSQLLGHAPQTYIPNFYAEFQLTGLRLGIFRPKETQLEEFASTGQSGMSLCLEVSDLEAAIAHLDALGFPPAGEILTASHGREIYACDPAGNRLILHQSGEFRVL
ncbi:VOC family protein [Kamptonema formosum]|uniref:VOC family protein n=1 Tax=Kamptonema formosum TaxID=331992 RepID=UPI0003452CBB|nr:VOC family protein [Oscillatoria sp. PCC 10802]